MKLLKLAPVNVLLTVALVLSVSASALEDRGYGIKAESEKLTNYLGERKQINAKWHLNHPTPLKVSHKGYKKYHYRKHRHRYHYYHERPRYKHHRYGFHYWHDHRQHGYRHRLYKHHHYYYNHVGFYFPGLGHIKHGHRHHRHCPDWHFDALVAGAVLNTIINSD